MVDFGQDAARVDAVRQEQEAEAAALRAATENAAAAKAAAARDAAAAKAGAAKKAAAAKAARAALEKAAAAKAAEAAKERAAASARANRSRDRAPITVTPGSAQDIGRKLAAARGWGDSEFRCLVPLWDHESGWRVDAANPSSSAYGIPQALPGRKMASAGADWKTSAKTQITWGLGYIADRYHTPCGAWSFWQAHSWY